MLDFPYTTGHLRITVEGKIWINQFFNNGWAQLQNLQLLLVDGCDGNKNHVVIELFSDTCTRWNIDWKIWVHDRYGNEYWTGGDSANGTTTGLVWRRDLHICWSSTLAPVVFDLAKLIS
jgi:hypothetical protein